MMESMAKSITYPPDPDYYEYNDSHVYNRLGRWDASGWGYDANSMQAPYVGGGKQFSGRPQKWGIPSTNLDGEGDTEEYVGRTGFREGHMRHGGREERGHKNTGLGRGFQGAGGHETCFTFGERRRGGYKRL